MFPICFAQSQLCGHEPFGPLAQPVDRFAWEEKVSGLFSDRSLFDIVLLWDDQNGRMRLAVFIML
jgi:hypothetical protein